MLKIVSRSERELELKRLTERFSFAVEHPEEKKVREILGAVKKEKNKAVIKFTREFDKVELSPLDLRVKKEEIEEAYRRVEDGYLKALRLAIKNISSFHKKEKADEWFETMPEDVVLGLRCVPIERVGFYVPGGRAAYPSTVLMSAIPAKIAGVAEMVMVTPPHSEKGQAKINPYILVAAKEAGVESIFKVGGAQAIAALAYGTETIPKVDKIVGPGNLYVTLAKKLVFGVVGIDKLAGPSELLVIADSEADPKFIAADLLSQAEHDPLAEVLLITTSRKIAEKVQRELSKQIEKLADKGTIQKALKNGVIFLVDNLYEAAELANRIAPEHLELMVEVPQNLLERIKHAGAVFLGPYSPETVGDYLAGPNHILPTGGTARFSSPLGVYDFIKKQSIIGYTKPALEKVRRELEKLTSVESLEAHGKAIEIRFE